MPVTAVTYFVSFILLGTMIILNLFIGVIMNGMTEAQEEAGEARARRSGQDLGDELAELEAQLAVMQRRLAQLRQRAAHADPEAPPQRQSA